jgi:4-hydroxymandelate synthase
MRSVPDPPDPVAGDLLELWVADLAGARQLLTEAFGFRLLVLPVPRRPDEQAVCLGNGAVHAVVRQGTSAASPVSRHVAVHGDTIADVGLVCADPVETAARARAHGMVVRDVAGTPTLDVFGDGTVCHALRRAPVAAVPATAEAPRVDHVAYCLPWGGADAAAQAYQSVLGLERVDVGAAAEVGGDAAGMRSVVLRSAGGLTVVLTEPISPAGDGQTQRFVDAHAGPGVQHVALAYDDLFSAVAALRRNGVRFLPFPDTYYAEARQRLPHLPVPWDTLHPLGVLVDADDRGLLYQLFTHPLTARRTFFLELVQRAGAVGFGANHVRALFAAVEAARDAETSLTGRVES